MQLNNTRILLTGASGGLGQVLARELAGAGASLLLTSRDSDALAQIDLPAHCECRRLQTDLTQSDGIAATVEAARDFGANILVNNAGVSCFGLLSEQHWEDVDRILATNLAVPIRLTQALLPFLLEQPAAAVVNIGSTFGSIPFAGFTAYSAAKAGLRGFSQALRRELADTRVRVVHIAPRAIDTAFNSPAVQALNKALGSKADPADKVAHRIVLMLRNDIAETHIGFPECLFAWLNGCAPGLVDRGLRNKLTCIKQHASR